MIQHEQLIPYTERYRSLQMTGLNITCELRHGGHVSNYNGIMIDNLLANAVVQEATRGAMLPVSELPYQMPVPLMAVWADEHGLPLYAASALLPIGETATDAIYMHKRMQTGRFSKAKNGKLLLEGIKGRYMERRVPIPTVTCEALQAIAIGNADEVRRLLRYITHIGKRRNSGLGEVQAWVVATANITLRECFIQDGKLTRTFPRAAADLLGGVTARDSEGLVTFTPPYWLPGTEVPGWFAGAPVMETDLCN